MGTSCNVYPLGLLALLCLATGTSGQPAAHGGHPPMPNQTFYFYCRVEGGPKTSSVEAEVPVQLTSSMAEAQLDQTIDLPGSSTRVRLTRYLPQATLVQRALPSDAPTSLRALEFVIDGASSSVRRWLIADDPARNRLVSFVGTWRYMAVTDTRERRQLLRQFEGELTRDPTVKVMRTDTGRSATVPARVGMNRDLSILECKVTVRGFMPDFAFDRETKKPVTKSEKRRNPAALVSIEYLGKSEERWVFAKFPDFGAPSKDALPFRITLDCPIDGGASTPDFLLVTVGQDAHEVWTRMGGTVSTNRLSLKQQIKVKDSPYTFHIEEYLPKARLTEEYKPDTEGNKVTVLALEVTSPGGVPETHWLELGKQHTISTSDGMLNTAFGRQPGRLQPTHP